MIPWFRFKRVPWGTVYLVQSRDDPRLFKVGYTKRRTKDRRAELNRVAGDDMRIVSTIAMPWARSCEAMVLRHLRVNPFRRGDRRGTEWFWLRSNEDIRKIETLIARSAARIELVAKLKMSWPKNVRARRFKAALPSHIQQGSVK